MLRGLIKKNIFIILIAISVFLIPVLVEAGMSGSKGGHMTSSYNPYNYSSNYYGRNDSALGLYESIYGGGLYGGTYGGGLYGGTYGGGLYGGTYGGGLYGGTYGGGLYGSTFGGGLYGSTFGGGLYGGLYGNSGLNQVISNEYTTEQSQTWYVPGGEYTTTISESTEISTIPSYGALYNPYNFFGLGSLGGFGGWY